MLRTLLAFALALAAAVAQAAGLPAEAARALKEAKIPEDAVGVYIRAVDAGRPLVALNTGQAFDPASVMKLVTTYAALDILGPAYSFRTEALASGPVRGGVLEGDLILTGSGDPGFTRADLRELLEAVRDTGIRRIDGDIRIDSSAYALPPHDPGAFDGEPLRPYNTDPAAFLVGWQAHAVHLLAGGGEAKAAIHPGLPGGIDNRLTLSDDLCGDWREKLAPRMENGRLVLEGRFPADCGDRTLYLRLLDNDAYNSAVVAETWRELGGELAGRTIPGTLPGRGVSIAFHDSPPLAQLVRDINKWSNNTMAKALFLAIGTTAHGPPATWEKAGQAIRCWLEAKGIAAPEFAIENGAGLSRIARITPATLGEILVDAGRGLVTPELLASLPLAATDGTMRRRLRDVGSRGWARLKTGTLSDAKAVAGFARALSGRDYVVVFLVNHPRAPLATQAQDALLEWLYRNG